jgi:hypothetical protein
MLNRADRALLMAKEAGRNVVIQLGSGMSEETAETRRGWWFWQKDRVDALLERHLVTNVPMNIAVEKLRGFVSDHQARITAIDGDRVEIYLPPGKLGLLRRQTDRAIPLLLEMEFSQEKVTTRNSNGKETGERQLTRIHLTMRPKRNRDRRASASEQARLVLSSLRAYLMANEAPLAHEKGVLKKATSLLSPWLAKR